jgi:hypothetical protein
MATDTTEIALSRETEQRFFMVEGDHEDESKTRKFIFKHRPHYGLLVPSTGSLLITGLSMAAFNPSSLLDLRGMREGDIVIVESDPDDEVYQVWDPPEDYRIQKGYREAFRVRNRSEDALQYPISVLERAI